MLAVTTTTALKITLYIIIITSQNIHQSNYKGITITMAGSGHASQPFYMPLLFPAYNVASAVFKPQEEKGIEKSIPHSLGLFAYLATVAASYRAAVLAWLAMYWLGEYPGYGEARVLEAGWMGRIVIRNLVFTWVVCGFWDWFLYFSPIKEKLFKYKITPKYPSLDQFLHDAKYTTLASIIAAGMECLLCHLWATGALSYQRDWWDTPVFNFVIAGTMVLWRSPHFYLIHRTMHPWRIPGVPDIGSFLYRKVHSLHHKSHNPTAWSGTSMHPVESLVYYSACLLPALLCLHPVHTLATIVDCGLAAWTSHDGFVWPGSGSTFHMMHHSQFDCNYGGIQVPLDRWFGTFAASKEEVRGIWDKK